MPRRSDRHMKPESRLDRTLIVIVVMVIIIVIVEVIVVVVVGLGDLDRHRLNLGCPKNCGSGMWAVGSEICREHEV